MCGLRRQPELVVKQQGEISNRSCSYAKAVLLSERASSHSATTSCETPHSTRQVTSLCTNPFAAAKLTQARETFTQALSWRLVSTILAPGDGSSGTPPSYPTSPFLLLPKEVSTASTTRSVALNSPRNRTCVHCVMKTEFRSCYPGWSAMVRSRLTATSVSWVQAILLPQPP
ncbi:hypothetical protein AAY473_037355, partial [Plecturocebus cupreus]